MLLFRWAPADDLGPKAVLAARIARGRRQARHGAFHERTGNDLADVDCGLPRAIFLRRRGEAGENQDDEFHFAFPSQEETLLVPSVTA